MIDKEIVLIEWVDSDNTMGWHGEECWPEIVPCYSVGWVVAQDDKQIKLEQTIGRQQYNNGIAIPWVSIQSIKTLFPLVEHGGSNDT
jgi:hypothetical protein